MSAAKLLRAMTISMMLLVVEKKVNAHYSTRRKNAMKPKFNVPKRR